jgi:hypothetical protein
VAASYADKRKYREIKARYSERDERHAQVIAARQGDVDKLMPGLFPAKWPRQVTANMLDIAAQDLGELLGELPEITCRPTRMNSDTAKRQAAKRTKILADYLKHSRLQQQMYGGADRMVTFAALPIVVEPDFKSRKPTLRVDSPVGAYYDLDLFGQVKCYYKCWYETVGSLVAKFPELEALIRYGRGGRGPVLLDRGKSDNDMLEVVKYYGPDKTCIFLPDRDDLELAEAPNPLGRTPVFIAELPKWDDQTRGRFDQMLWIQVARARMSLFMIEAADKSINAPLVLPRDINKISFGPNAVIHTDSPNPVRRVPLEMPQSIFAENATLQQEERLAARYPEVRSGNIDASIITGQGVRELAGTVDSQVKTCQDLIGIVLGDALSFALEMDERYWPNEEKTIEGQERGADFEDTYVPSKAIAGNYRVHVSYGLSYGMDHQRGLIFALQLRGDRIVDRGSVREQFARAFGGSAEEIEHAVDIEEIDDALKQSIFQLAASIPAAAAQGMDPTRIVHQMATVQKERAKGQSLADALAKAFEPTPEEREAAERAQDAAMQDPMAAMAAELGMGDAPGPAGAVPTSPAGATSGDLQTLLAGLTSTGRPQLSVGVSRMRPT